MKQQPIFRNENYPEGANLTPEQQSYDVLWKASRTMQRGGERPTQIAVGFKPLPCARSVSPLRPSKPIRDLDSVVAVLMIPIPSEHWRGASGDRRYRFHTVELAAEFYQGEVQFRTAGLRFDFAKSPLQDHQVFSLARFDPGSVGAMIEQAMDGKEAKEVVESHELCTPLGGDLVTVRDDLFLNVVVGKTIIYRFNLDAEVEIVADKSVRKGDQVARLIGKQRYQVAELKRNGCDPKMDLIGPDVLSATRFRPMFRLANQLKFGIVDGEGVPVRQASKLLPKLLAVFPLEETGEHGDWVEAIRAAGSFEPSGELKKQILAAVQPSGSFGIRAPVDGRFVGVSDFGPYKQADFQRESGQVETLVLPKCAVLHGPFREDQQIEVTKGDVIGDWVERNYYQDYIDLGGMAESGLVAIESAYLRSQVITTGEKGFDEDGVAVDARLVESVLGESDGFKLDFTNLLTAEGGYFYRKKDGSAAPVLIKTDHAQIYGVGFTSNGIRYAPPLAGYTEKAERRQTTKTSGSRGKRPGGPKGRQSQRVSAK